MPTPQCRELVRSIAEQQRAFCLRMSQFHKVSTNDAYRKLATLPDSKAEHLENLLSEWVSGLSSEVERHALSCFRSVARRPNLSQAAARAALDELVASGVFVTAFHFPDIDFEKSTDDHVAGISYSAAGEPIERFQEAVMALVRYACDGWRQLDTGRGRDRLPAPRTDSLIAIPVWTPPEWMFPDFNAGADCFWLDRAFREYCKHWAEKLKDALITSINDAASASFQPTTRKGGRPRTTSTHESIKHIAFLKNHQRFDNEKVKALLLVKQIPMLPALIDAGCTGWVDPKCRRAIGKLIDKYRKTRVQGKDIDRRKAEYSGLYSTLALSSTRKRAVHETSPKR